MVSFVLFWIDDCAFQPSIHSISIPAYSSRAHEYGVVGGLNHFPARTGANQPKTNTANVKLTETSLGQNTLSGPYFHCHCFANLSTTANAFNQPLKSLHYNPGYPHFQSICSVVCICAALSCCTVFKSLQG